MLLSMLKQTTPFNPFDIVLGYAVPRDAEVVGDALLGCGDCENKKIKKNETRM